MDDPLGQRFAGAEIIHHIPVGVPDMENDGLVHFQRQIDLLIHHFFLCVPGRQIVIVIQADFSQCHHFFPAQQGTKDGKVILRRVLAVMGMNARRGKDPFMGKGEIHASLGRGNVAAHAYAALHPRFQHPLIGFLTVKLIFFIIQMAMGVKYSHSER